MNENRCNGMRRQFRKGVYGVFKCNRKAVVIIETSVGFTETFIACNDPECFASIAHGYPVNCKPIKAKT